MTNIEALKLKGQSIWYDFIRRSLLTSGELAALIDQGLTGITYNPTIFEKAIVGSSDYDSALKQLIAADKSVTDIYEALAVDDIAQAADQFKPIYNTTGAKDGYVSLEVDPHLAHDTAKTISEARRLFTTVGRPNVMIKVPATTAGIPAIHQLIGSGVNINVTLIFGLDNYRAVAEAYVSGLETLAEKGPSVDGGHGVAQVASVASFFVSRVDSAVDKALDAIGQNELKGKIAVANAKVAYAEYQQIFGGSRFKSLAAKGAHEQRVLWASTGTKNPAYADTLYVDELIGPNTVNTLPPSTLDYFIDHGRVADTLTRDVGEARRQLDRLNALGIDLNRITQTLQDDGVASLAQSFDMLMQGIAVKKEQLTY